MLEKVLIVFSCLLLASAFDEDAYFYHQHGGGDIHVHFHENHDAHAHGHNDNSSMEHDIDGHHFHVFGPLHIHVFDDDEVGDHHVHHHHRDSHEHHGDQHHFDHQHGNYSGHNMSGHYHPGHGNFSDHPYHHPDASNKDHEHEKMSADELAHHSRYHHKEHPHSYHHEPHRSHDDHSQHGDEHDHNGLHDDHDDNDGHDQHTSAGGGHKHDSSHGDEKRYGHRMREMHKMHKMHKMQKMHKMHGMKHKMHGMKGKMHGMKDKMAGMKSKMGMKKCSCCSGGMMGGGSDSHGHDMASGHEGMEHPAYVYARCDVVPNTRLSRADRGGNIRGAALLKQHYRDGPLFLDVSLRGFKVRDAVHGIHVHQYGEMTDSCESLGGHFNPTDVDHGGPADDTRHFGDLGNIQVDRRGRAISSTNHTLTSLVGHHNIIGRSLVIHERADDFGLGGSDASKKSGDAGKRVACCVVVRWRGDK